MKTKISTLGVLLAMTAALLLSGCSTTQDEQNRSALVTATIKTAIQYAVLEYYGSDIDRAMRVANVARVLLKNVGDGELSVDMTALVQAATKHQFYTDLEPQEKLLARNLMELIAAEARRFLDRPETGLTPSERAAVNEMEVARVLGWVIEATQLHSYGARAK